MICPKCQFANPELNRFCGMCGSPLPAAESQEQAVQSDVDDASANHDRRPFIVSTTATGDATLSNSRVVAPSPTIGSTTHGSYLPLSPLKAHPDYEEFAQPGPSAVDPADEPLFAKDTRVEENLRPEFAGAGEHDDRSVRRPIPISNASTSGSILGLSSTPIETERFEESTPAALDERVESSREEVHSAPNPYLTFDETPSGSAGDVSGPSFLGLGAADNPDYLLEEQRSSHARAYLVLFVLLVVGVLGFMEWRASSRGESMNPMDVLHVRLPDKKGQGQAVVEPPAPNETATAATPANGNDTGKPDLVAEPTQPAAKPASVPPANSTAAPEAAQSSTPATTPADSSPANNAAANTTSTPTPAAAAAKPTQDTAAQQEPPAPPAKKKPAEKKPVTVASAKPPAKPRAESSDADAAPDASLNAGSAELQKGIAAGATNEGRMWLWRAMGKGNGEAPVLLADMYAQGRGTPKDCEQAVLLLKAAAKKANPRARSKLGSMYASGQCVPQDRVEAYKWMHAALQVNPGSEWIQKNQETLWSQMSSGERRRAAAYR